MDWEMAVLGAVWAWARRVCPAEPGVAAAAVNVAWRCLGGGASAAEASERAHAFVCSWLDHPAHQEFRARDAYPIAS